MGTKDALRKRILRLTKLGVTQKAIAARMGMSEAALSRWMNDHAARISTDALDGFNAFASELNAATLDQGEETQRPAPPSETIPNQATGTAGPPFRERERGSKSETRRRTDR